MTGRPSGLGTTGGAARPLGGGDREVAGASFFLLLQLQSVIGFTALAAGASLLPVNACMLILSTQAGRCAATAGPRAPIASGAAVARWA